LKSQNQSSRLTTLIGDEDEAEYVILLSIRYAMGYRYYKYTLDGINILFVNSLAIVFFTLADFYLSGIANTTVIFICALLSVPSLAYFIGTAVASITAQTGSLALGAVINATFGSIVEILLYILALRDGNEKVVEGAIIGSFLLGVLVLPGAAMLSAGLIKKEMPIAKSAGVSSTLLIMALIAAFTPTFFQQIYGSFELRCDGCPAVNAQSASFMCKSCRYTQPHPTRDTLYLKHTRPLMYISSSILLLVYGIGLLFTLHTHSKQIYAIKGRPAIKKVNANQTQQQLISNKVIRSVGTTYSELVISQVATSKYTLLRIVN